MLVVEYIFTMRKARVIASGFSSISLWLRIKGVRLYLRPAISTVFGKLPSLQKREKDGVYITHAIPLQVTAKPGKIKEQKNANFSVNYTRFTSSKKRRNITVASVE
jgi:hypothetical protein